MLCLQSFIILLSSGLTARAMVTQPSVGAMRLVLAAVPVSWCLVPRGKETRVACIPQSHLLMLQCFLCEWFGLVMFLLTPPPEASCFQPQLIFPVNWCWNLWWSTCACLSVESWSLSPRVLRRTCEKAIEGWMLKILIYSSRTLAMSVPLSCMWPLWEGGPEDTRSGLVSLGSWFPLSRPRRFPRNFSNTKLISWTCKFSQ